MAARPTSWHSIDLTSFDLEPALRHVGRLPGKAIGRAVDGAKEATYVTVGLSLLTFQRAQVRRREIERALRN